MVENATPDAVGLESGADDGVAAVKRVAVVSAGLRQPSSTRLLADRLGEAVERALIEKGLNAELEVIELRDLAVDITNAMLTGVPSPALTSAIETVTSAHAVVAVSPIFTASYSGLFKSFFDILEEDALTGKPVLIAATGGTARHSLALEHALRPLFAYLRAVVVPTAVYASAEDWGADGLDARIARAAGELSDAAERYEPPAAEVAVVPFEQQLAALGA